MSLSRKSLSLFLIAVMCFSIIPFSFIEGATYTYEYEYQISHNDADAFRSGINYYDSEYHLKITNNSEQCTLGLVFDSVNIPKDTVIKDAKLEIYMVEFDQTWVKYFGGIWAGTYATYHIWGYNSTNSSYFENYADFLGKMTDRTPTHFYSLYQTSAWSSGWLDFEVTAQVQDLVNSPIWSTGENITLFVQNVVPDPFRSDQEWETWGRSYEFDPNSAPKLSISTSEPLTVSEFEQDPTGDNPSKITVSSYRVQHTSTAYSNYTESFWCTASIYGKTYISSSYGQNDFTEWYELMDISATSWNFDFWLEPNGRYFWIGYKNSTNGLWWRKGELFKNQTYEWLAPPQKIRDHSGNNWGYRDRLHHGGAICTSKSGIPFIAWERYDSTYGDSRTHVSWTNRTDGYLGEYYEEILEVSDAEYSTFDLLPHQGYHGVYAIYTDSDENYGGSGKLWEHLKVKATSVSYTGDPSGINFGSEKVVNIDYCGETKGFTYGAYKWSTSGNYKGWLGISFVEDDPATDKLSFRYLESPTSSLSSTEKVFDLVTNVDRLYPQTIVDENNNTIIMYFRHPDQTYSYLNHTIDYTIRWNNGTWGWLNSTTWTGQLEDFTTYTEVDTGSNRIVVNNATWVSHNSWRDEDTYLYKDYGVDYFDDFTHFFDAECDYKDIFGYGMVWSLANYLDDWKGLQTANRDALGVRMYSNADGNWIYLSEIDGGTYYGDSYLGVSANTIYYFNITKDDLNFTLEIYSDKGMTSLVDTLNLTLHHDYKFRYMYACQSGNTGSSKEVNTDVYNYNFSAYGYQYTYNRTKQWKYLNHTLANSTWYSQNIGSKFDVCLNDLDIFYDYDYYDVEEISSSQQAIITDTHYDTSTISNAKDYPKYICKNYTANPFNNMSLTAYVDTIHFYRDLGTDHWVWTPFLATKEFVNHTDSSSNGTVGLIVRVNSGNLGSSEWKWGVYARNSTNEDYDWESSWRSTGDNTYIDVRLFTHNNSIIAKIYDDLAHQTLESTLSLITPLINDTYNYAWIHQGYATDPDYGYDVDVDIFSKSSVIWGLWISDMATSPISVVWNTAENYYAYHDYLFFPDESFEYYARPKWSNLNHTHNYAGKDVNFTVTWDDTVLDKSIFSWNKTGSWVNDTAVDFDMTPQDIFVEKTLPSTINLTIGYKFYANNTDGYWNSTDIGLLTTNIPTQHLNTTLSTGKDEDGEVTAGVGAETDWVFVGEKYYFTSYVEGATTFNLTFNDGFNIHNITFKWDNATQTLWTQNLQNDEFVTGLFYTDYERSGIITKLVWGWIPEKNIVDALNVSVSYGIYNNITDATIKGDTGIRFNIYNLGGFGNYTDTNRGNTGRREGGDQFEIWNRGYYYSGAYDEVNASAIFRRLQHIHTTFSFYREMDYTGGYYTTITSDDDCIYFGIEYLHNGTWINGWEVRIKIEESGLVGRGGVNADSSYDVLNITWWTQGVCEKWDKITVYNHGYSFHGDEPNNRTFNRLWLDLWFNKINSSSVVGGRVAPYYNGMWEWNANPFWFGYGDFAPYWDNNSALTSMYFTQLKDADGKVRSCYGLETMRFYVGIRKIDDFLMHTWQLQDYQIFDVKLADDRMEGINTPDFVEPEDISMPKAGGFLQPLVNAINAISTGITKAMFNVVKLMIGAIDTFFDMIGLGEWWRNFSIMIKNISDLAIEIMGELQIALLNTATLIEQIFRFVTTIIGNMIYFVRNFISSMLSWYTWIKNMILGGDIFNTNLWLSLSLEDWFILFIHLLPVYWINRLANSDDWVKTAFNDIQLMVYLVTGLFHFLSKVIMLSIALFDLLIGLLPI